MTKPTLPKEGSYSSVGRRARKEAVYSFDEKFWEFRELTGQDAGLDMEFELILDGVYTHDKLVTQIKGRTDASYLDNGMISFPLDVKTIEYALKSPYSFLLLLYEVRTEELFFICIQDYFYENINLLNRLRKNLSTVSIQLDPKNTVSDINNQVLIELAKKRHSM